MRVSLNRLEFRQQPLVPRRDDQPLHPLRFGYSYLTAERRQSVVAPPLVVLVGGRPIARFLEDALDQQPLDHGVERARAEADLAVGLVLDFLQNGVAVLFAIAQREQYLKHRRGEWYHGRPPYDEINCSLRRHSCQEVPRKRHLAWVLITHI